MRVGDRGPPRSLVRGPPRRPKIRASHLPGRHEPTGPTALETSTDRNRKSGTGSQIELPTRLLSPCLASCLHTSIVEERAPSRPTSTTPHKATRVKPGKGPFLGYAWASTQDKPGGGTTPGLDPGVPAPGCTWVRRKKSHLGKTRQKISDPSGGSDFLPPPAGTFATLLDGPRFFPGSMDRGYSRVWWR